MKEVAVVLDLDGKPLCWHHPPGCTSASIPDSKPLWDVLWENRDRISAIAHMHPGTGAPSPSAVDLPTFRAVETGLGRRILWYIATLNAVVVVWWVGPGKNDYARAVVDDIPTWADELRRLSYEEELHSDEGTNAKPNEEVVP